MIVTYCQQTVWADRLHCRLMCCTMFTCCYQMESKQQQTWYERLYVTTSKTTSCVMKLQLFDILFCTCLIYFCACALLWCWDLLWLIFRLIHCRLDAGLPTCRMMWDCNSYFILRQWSWLSITERIVSVLMVRTHAERAINLWCCAGYAETLYVLNLHSAPVLWVPLFYIQYIKMFPPPLLSSTLRVYFSD